MRFGLAVLAAVSLLPVAGHAARVSGLYVGAGAGLSLLQDQTATGMILDGVNTPLFTGPVSFDPGYAVTGSLGWGFGNGLRAEIQGMYRSNALSRYPGAASFKASEQDYGAFLNLLYDIDLGGPVTPYVGLGVGEQTVQYKNGSISAPGAFIRLQHEDPDVAYQAIIGAAIDIGVPGLALTAEYHFIAQPNRHIVYGQYFAPGLDVPAEAHFSDDYDHLLLAGLRYSFDAAPPAVAAPVPPPPAREAARTYLIFFDWDRSELTPRAEQIVAEAARASTRTAVTRIEVDGHTDRSGSPAYNQALSRRRADTVAAALVRDGVPAGEITTQGFGETRPLVPTAAGVREPQNRRVEIVLR